MVRGCTSAACKEHCNPDVAGKQWALKLLTKNRSRMKNLALVTLGSSPASGVAAEDQREFYVSEVKQTEHDGNVRGLIALDSPETRGQA